jgi:hypothetical protein
MQKTFNATRIVLEVDQGWFEAIAKMTEYAEYGEVMTWVSSEKVKITKEVCDLCSTVADLDGILDHDEDLHEEEIK